MISYGSFYRRQLQLRAQRQSLRIARKHGLSTREQYTNGLFRRLLRQEYINAGASHLLEHNINYIR